MKRILALTKVVFKVSLQSMGFEQLFGNNKGKSKTKKILQKLLGVFLLLYLLAILFIPTNFAIRELNNIGQVSLSLNLLFTVAPALILFFTILSVPGVLYFAKDIESYLPLPFEAWEITFAKFVTSYLQSLMTVFFFFIPVFINYMIIAKPAILFIFFAILASLIIPMIPLAIAFLVIVIIMRFVPFLRNKDLFIYISTGLVFIPIFIIIFFANGSDFDSTTVKRVVESLLAMDDNTFRSLSLFLPTSRWLSIAVVDSNFLYILLSLGVSLITCALAIFIAQPLYFAGAIGLNEQSSKKRSLRLNELDKETKVKSFSKSFLVYDLKHILRTPTFAINYLSTIVIIPLMMALPALMKLDIISLIQNDLGIVRTTFNVYFNSIEFFDQVAITILVAMTVGIYASNFEASSSTAISREGKDLKTYLTFPIKFSEIVHAKAKLSLILASIIPVVITLTAIVVLGPNLLTLFIFLVFLILSMILTTYVSLLMDIMYPKLEWNTEQEAVKGNFIQVMVILPFMFVPILLILLYSTLPAIVSSIIFIVAIPALVYFLIKLTTSLANTRLVKKVQNL